jgi:hypothetical protein
MKSQNEGGFGPPRAVTQWKKKKSSNTGVHVNYKKTSVSTPHRTQSIIKSNTLTHMKHINTLYVYNAEVVYTVKLPVGFNGSPFEA